MVRRRDASPSKGRELRETVQKWLCEWFASRAKVGNGARENLLETDYFAAGWLTSMEIVEFVTEIESQFDMQFSEADLQDRRFVTISGLSELILQCITPAHQSRLG